MSLSSATGDLYGSAARLLGGGFLSGLAGVPQQLGAKAPPTSSNPATFSPDISIARGYRVFNYAGGAMLGAPSVVLPTNYLAGQPSSASPPGGSGSGGGQGLGTDSLTLIVIVALIALVIWGRKK